MADYEWFDGDPAVKAFVARALSELTPADIDAVSALKTYDAQTGTTYTLALGDLGAVVTMTNASASTLTIPPNSAVAFPVGCTLEVVQLGAGLVTVAAGAGVTAHSHHTLKTLGQYSKVTLEQVAANTWIVSGDVALV